MAFKREAPISLYADKVEKDFLTAEAAKRHMNLSAFCMRLIARGLAMDEIEKATETMREIAQGGVQRAMLREMFATRYIVEAFAKGAIHSTATIGTDANTYADKEIEKKLGIGIS